MGISFGNLGLIPGKRNTLKDKALQDPDEKIYTGTLTDNPESDYRFTPFRPDPWVSKFNKSPYSEVWNSKTFGPDQIASSQKLIEDAVFDRPGKLNTPGVYGGENVIDWYSKYTDSRLVTDEDYVSKDTPFNMGVEPASAGNTEQNPNEDGITPSNSTKI